MRTFTYPMPIKVQAVFCSVLLLSLHVVVGCGTTASSSLSNGAVYIPLTVDHPLTSALNGSMYQGAKGIEVDQVTGRFRIIFDDSSRDLSGLMERIDGKYVVRQFTMIHGGESLTLLFNEAHQITTMMGSHGEIWHRPADSVATSRVSSADGSNPYISANADILEQARLFDEGVSTQAATSGNDANGGVATGPKLNAQLATAPLLFFFLFLPVAAVGSIIFILELVGIISLVA